MLLKMSLEKDCKVPIFSISEMNFALQKKLWRARKKLILLIPKLCFSFYLRTFKDLTRIPKDTTTISNQNYQSHFCKTYVIFNTVSEAFFFFCICLRSLPVGHECQVGAVGAGEGDRAHRGADYADAHRLKT